MWQSRWCSDDLGRDEIATPHQVRGGNDKLSTHEMADVIAEDRHLWYPVAAPAEGRRGFCQPSPEVPLCTRP